MTSPSESVVLEPPNGCSTSCQPRPIALGKSGKGKGRGEEGEGRGGEETVGVPPVYSLPIGCLGSAPLLSTPDTGVGEEPYDPAWSMALNEVQMARGIRLDVSFAPYEGPPLNTKQFRGGRADRRWSLLARWRGSGCKMGRVQLHPLRQYQPGKLQGHSTYTLSYSHAPRLSWYALPRAAPSQATSRARLWPS